jgi:hypothetical protein
LGDDVDAALAPLVQGRLAPIGVQRRTAEEVWIGGMPFEKYQFECQVVLDVREERVVGVRYYTPDTNEAPLHAPPDRFLEPPPGDPVR